MRTIPLPLAEQIKLGFNEPSRTTSLLLVNSAWRRVRGLPAPAFCDLLADPVVGQTAVRMVGRAGCVSVRSTTGAKATSKGLQSVNMRELKQRL